MNNLLLGVALFVGALLPVQAGINSQLGRALGHPVAAAFASFFIGTVTLLAFSGSLGLSWPSAATLGRVPLWMWAGGVMGALFVTGSVIIAPRLGASTMVGFIVAGQLFASLVIDHFGWVGFASHPITPLRVVGAGLLVLALVLIRNF